MNWLDIVLVVIVGVGAFRGMSIGIIGAAITAAGVFIGWLLAGQLSDDVGGLFDSSVSNDTLVTVISYAIIIIIAVAVATYVGRIVRPILTVATLGLSSMVDKVGGLALGLVFGLAIAFTIVIAMARFTYDFEVPEEGVVGTVAGRIPVENTRDSLENALDGSAIVPVVVDVADAIPASALGFVPSDFKKSLEILEQNID